MNPTPEPFAQNSLRSNRTPATMTTKTRAPRVAELASDEGYNLQGQPVLLAKLTAYVSRPVFAQLAQLATACNGEYSKHNQAFQFPATATAARESFAAQARVILTNPPPAATAQPKRARVSSAVDAIEARHWQRAESGEAPPGYNEIMRFMAQPPAISPTAYTDAPTVETPPAIRVSVSRPILSTITDRTPPGYGPAQSALF